MVRDISNSYNCNISFRSKRISNSTKKIGIYFAKLKNTISSFQREISSVSKDLDTEEDIVNKNISKKETTLGKENERE